MGQLTIATRAYLDTFIARRPGEIKLGERVETVNGQDWRAAIADSDAKFVLLGIPEDIGVRANLGIGGAHTLWEPALKALLNVQDTEKLNGRSLLVLGAFDLTEEMKLSEDAGLEALRALVAHIDELVYPIITAITAAGKIPLVVGGGHNNAYPLLKGAANGRGKAINCINLDAHSDYRAMEGRHSGNGFRYARQDRYLDKYAVVGLHENYNAQNIVAEFKEDPALCFSSFEDIFIKEKNTFQGALGEATEHVKHAPAGIELDLDCIERVLSSAATPSGISTLQARKYITTCVRELTPAYLHLTEGAVQLRDGRADAGATKLVAYFLTDFMKAFFEK